MSNDYLNPFGVNNISNISSTTLTTSVGVVDNSNASIMANNSSATMNYLLSPSELKEEDVELIKKELERKIQEQKDDLENVKSTRGWATSALNSVKGWFGGGDKKAQNSIANYEALLFGLDLDISNIDEVYKTIMGSELDSVSLQSLKSSEALANSIDSETQEALIAELENQIAVLENNFETAKNSNGWISGTWNKFKNWTGIGASSNKTSTEIADLKEQIEKLKNGEADFATIFKNITGEDLNADNLTSLLSGEAGTGLDSVSVAGQSVNNYSEGQKMCTDVVGDMVSGIAAVGALAAAPFTGGASLLLAAGVGAGVKVAIKASDCIGNEKTYDLKDLGYDFVTGSINGAMAPISNGLGGAAGTGVAKAFGLEARESTAKKGLQQAVKTAGKEVLEEVVEEGAEAVVKTIAKEAIEEGAEQAGKGIISKILAKQGMEYAIKEGAEASAKTTIGKIASYAADMAVDGALSGATDGFARATAEGRIEDIPQEMLQGGLGGLIASPIIGGGFRVATNAGSTVINKINNKITIGSLLPDGSMTKFSQGDMGDCALLSMLDGFLGNSKTSKQIKNAITTSPDGGYNVKIGSRTVKIAREELSDEMLSDTTGIRVFELAYQKAGGSLDGEFAENVAKTFGLNPVHIDSDNITDEVLETISKDSNNLILSLGARVDADGTITPDGEFQHYFSIKNVDPETKTLTLVDTYDTSKTFEMSFDDVKTQGVSIDGGSVKKTDLPNIARSADEVGFRGAQNVDLNIEEQIQERINKLDYADEFDADDISDLAKGIECVKERLQASNIEFSEEDILDIIEAGEYFDPSQIITTLTSMSNVKDVGKAYMLSQLIKQGVLSKESLMEITGGWGASDSFGKAFCDNLSHNSDYFTTILKTCGFDDEKIAELVKISEMIADGDVVVSDLKEIMPNITAMSSIEIKAFLENIYQEEYLGLRGKLIEIYEILGIQGRDLEILLKQLDEAPKYKSDIEQLRVMAEQIDKLNNYIANNSKISELINNGKLSKQELLFALELSDSKFAIVDRILNDDELFEKINIAKAIDLSNNGYTQAEIENVISLIKDNIDYADAINITTNETIQQQYLKLINEGVNKKYASILANVEDIENYDVATLCKLLDLIKPFEATSNTGISETLSNYLKANPKIDISELTEYVGSLNFDNLLNIAPEIQNFTSEQYLKFADYHFKNGAKKEFTTEDLTLDNDFTTYLMNNYIDADKLSELLTVYPATSRNVGTMPKGWLDNVTIENQTKVIDDIYGAISDFQTNKDIDAFALKMSELLGKNVAVKKLGSGSFGTGYKISMDGADDMCLKLFDVQLGHFMLGDTTNIHGQHIEVQTGLFANKHSNDFVRMYFGRVSPSNTSDGFLVTQFLSDSITPDVLEDVDLTSYLVKSSDVVEEYGHNIINGKIIDFGAVSVEKNNW